MMQNRTSDLADRHPGLVRGHSSSLISYGGRKAFAGAVETVRTFEDAQLIRLCLSQPGAGRVLVVDAGGSRRVAVLGDNMARLGMQNGWAGIVLHGAVRDCDALVELDFGVLALGAVPLCGNHAGAGERGCPVDFAGMQFLPGNHLYCDADGILLTDWPLPN